MASIWVRHAIVDRMISNLDKDVERIVRIAVS